MTGEKPTIREQLEAEEQRVRNHLADFRLDGPFEFPAGGMFGITFGPGPRESFAICLRCGAVVVLNDPQELTGGGQIERGVRLHVEFHERLGS